jgi:hypothetical protein
VFPTLLDVEVVQSPQSISDSCVFAFQLVPERHALFGVSEAAEFLRGDLGVGQDEWVVDGFQLLLEVLRFKTGVASENGGDFGALDVEFLVGKEDKGLPGFNVFVHVTELLGVVGD